MIYGTTRKVSCFYTCDRCCGRACKGEIKHSGRCDCRTDCASEIGPFDHLVGVIPVELIEDDPTDEAPFPFDTEEPTFIGNKGSATP